MAQITIKTPYYYQLLEEAKGNRSNISRDRNKSCSTLNFTERMHQVTQSATHNLKIGRKVNGLILRLFQGLLLAFVKKARISFPLVRILFKNGELAGREFYIYNINPPVNPAGYINLGRENTQRERFFIRLFRQTVSRTHARIVFFNDEMFIVNYSKVNPTQVNGQAIPFNYSIPLPEGAVISIGGVEFTAEKVKL